MASLIQFNGPVWRVLPKAHAETPAMPAQATEGRFQHSGQVAAYASLIAKGAAVAIKRYLTDGTMRAMIPMWLDADRVVDMRGNWDVSIVWQDIRATGMPSPTWAFSDMARDTGAQAMLYSSRSRPDLSHVVVFGTACLAYVGPITDFDAIT